MRNFLTITIITTFQLILISSYSQPKSLKDNLPVFKKIGHSFLPPLTSPYFFFSSDDLLWFSSAKGLTSFDGSDIIYYSTQNETALLGLNKIKTIAEDADHNLYLGANDKIIFFNRSNNHFYQIPYKYTDTKNPAGLLINSLFIDDNKTVYAGLNYKGLLIYHKGSNNFETIEINSPEADSCTCDNIYFSSVLSIAADAKDGNKLWLGTYNGICLYDKRAKKITRNFKVINPGINKFSKIPIFYDVKKMHIINDSIIWFNTTSNGFGKYNTRTGEARLFIQDALIHEKDLWKSYTLCGFANWSADKYILGITIPSPGIFDAKTGKLELFNVITDPGSFDAIEYISNDRKGNVWFLDRGYLYASIPEYYYLKSVDIEKQLTHDYLPNRFGGILFDKSNSLYYASVVFSSGIYVLDTAFNIVKIIPAPLFTNRYTYKETANEFIAKDGNNRIWTTCLETYILEPGSKKFEYAEKISPKLQWLKSTDEMLGICTRNNGNIFLRSVGGKYYEIDQKNFDTDTIKILSEDESIDFAIGSAIIQYDSIRDFLYINNKKKIIQFDLNTRREKHVPISVLVGNNNVRNQKIEYALDGEGGIWVWIPQYGFRIIDPDKMQCIDSIPIGEKGLQAGSYDFLRNGGKESMFLTGTSGIVIYNYKRKESLWLEYPNVISNPFPYYLGYCNNHLFANERNRILYYDLNNFYEFNFSVIAGLNTIIQDNNTIFTRGVNDTNVKIDLKHFQNSLTFSFSAPEFFSPDKIEYAYKLSDVDNEWHYTNSFNRKVTYSNLEPGSYTFQLKAQIEGGDWQGHEADYKINIAPPFWQTTWFKIIAVLVIGVLIDVVITWRIRSVRKQEQLKATYEKELLELEAKALRAQMNPHFIFNCMNSIKSLIQEDEKSKAVVYLTTFSKLIRTVFHNSDKREITLFDEIETCRLYTQLESMRFENKFNYEYNIDETVDLRSIQVPALIIQPFIENAIWHGIMPKEEGGHLLVSVQKVNNVLQCIIDDNGIGRETSKQNKFQSETAMHQSKGVHLTQARLNLDNLLNERNGTIQIIDKKDERGRSTGTTVILTFNEY